MSLVIQIAIGVVIGKVVWILLQTLAGVVIGVFDLDRKWAAMFQ